MNTLWPRALVVTPLKTQWLCDLPGRPSLLPGRRNPSRPSTPRALRVVGVTPPTPSPPPPPTRSHLAPGAGKREEPGQQTPSVRFHPPRRRRPQNAGPRRVRARPAPGRTGPHATPHPTLCCIQLTSTLSETAGDMYIYIYIQVHPNRCECVTRGLRRRRVSRRRARRWLWGR